MVINKENIQDIEDIYIHDFIMIDFNYNNLMGLLDINFLSNRKELMSKKFIFEDVIYVEYDNVNYWSGDGVPFDCIGYDKDCTKFNTLVKKNSDNRKDDWSIPSKLEGDVLEVSFYNLSGGELRIICRSIIYSEINS